MAKFPIVTFRSINLVNKMSGSHGDLNFGTILRKNDHTFFFFWHVQTRYWKHWKRHEALKQVRPRQEGE